MHRTTYGCTLGSSTSVYGQNSIYSCRGNKAQGRETPAFFGTVSRFRRHRARDGELTSEHFVRQEIFNDNAKLLGIRNPDNPRRANRYWAERSLKRLGRAFPAASTPHQGPVTRRLANDLALIRLKTSTMLLRLKRKSSTPVSVPVPENSPPLRTFRKNGTLVSIVRLEFCGQHPNWREVCGVGAFC